MSTSTGSVNNERQGAGSVTMTPNLLLEHFPLRSTDKLRYADTDRQGHVNNAVFATLFETGRVDLLYDESKPLREPGTAFVIARLAIDFHAEIVWPGAIDIGTRVEKLGRSSIGLAQALFQNGRCVAKAESVLVLMNEATRKSHPLSPQAIDCLSRFMGKDGGAETS
jgi:acyl-CoA thioester hydrolase